MFPVKNPFSAAEDAVLRKLAGEGRSAIAIAKKMDRPESSVYRRMDVLGLRNARPSKTQRRCLCCSKDFLSDGPHNRLCGSCRIKNTSPYQP